MKQLLTSCLVTLCAMATMAQVDLNVPIRLTGPEDQRRIDGIGQPAQSDAAVTVEAAVRDGWRWCTAQRIADTLELSTTPTVVPVRDGLLLRFAVPQDMSGRLWARIQGGAAMPLLRTDGVNPTWGQMTTGRIAEVLVAAGRYTLLNLPEPECPPATISVNSNFCIDQTTVAGQLIYQAMDRCARRGGKLCTLDEYSAACSLVGTQLTGMFNEWEWIDDTSNHSHTADQAGRFTCTSHRSESVLLVRVAETRCCYHKR
ncbi:MAG: hypothetical protein JNL52_15780 [Flavobacteriales bacterium]|nr:hypothetical protein [Flavobacteriales bacterium]